MGFGENDEPHFEPVGDLSTVDGLLAYLGVGDAERPKQRRAVARALRQPTLREFVRRLGLELMARGLAG
jgi:hypothetical protein